MNSRAGLSLLEVLVAIGVLATGALVGAAMQVTAVRASSDAAAIQGVTKLAENELALRRQMDLTTAAGRATACRAAVPEGYSCQVSVLPCQLAGTGTNVALSCATGGSQPVADQVTVTVRGPRDKSITLRTVKAR